MKNKTAFLLMFVFASLAIFAEKPVRTSVRMSSEVSKQTNEKIVRTLKESQRNVYDYDGDGLVNCIDYSCLFKLTWDKNFPSEKSRCTIIRNLQPGVMNHLFAQVLDENSRVIEVEPWAWSPYAYLMSENWQKGKYNPQYNYYGETERWLSEGRRRRAKSTDIFPLSYIPSARR